jgi:hypothetical protein
VSACVRVRSCRRAHPLALVCAADLRCSALRCAAAGADRRRNRRLVCDRQPRHPAARGGRAVARAQLPARRAMRGQTDRRLCGTSLSAWGGAHLAAGGSPFGCGGGEPIWVLAAASGEGVRGQRGRRERRRLCAAGGAADVRHCVPWGGRGTALHPFWGWLQMIRPRHFGLFPLRPVPT